ncbi:MED6-domain-containing protein [Microstroma glucosiphilum]|uniref:Mediator of RNA polymerase II transcription subunit 6 n=1 Tax=Pseudomicrostroma glucosiphilum TaxID=1684307 RepID=A0A316UIA4_9BASI|nr:MED6-domain-containing protein [Pseudomicrostroma glucosiphilum]PWN24061.1 MED6-domain-containing protein [Pseudomicrostroma glucosiphilum]
MAAAVDDAGGVDPNTPLPTPTRSTLLSTYWRDPEYLAYVPLNPTTALDYFSRSTFFDPASTNEMLRMQNIANPEAMAGAMGRTARQQEEELSRFVGIEFVLVHAKQNKGKEAAGTQGQQAQNVVPPGQGQQLADETLFVIQKRRRESPAKTHVLETYYILNGNIHMAPDLETVLNNRMTTALHSLRSALSLARDASGRPILPPSASAKSNGANKRKGAPTSSSDGVRAAGNASTNVGAAIGTEGGPTLGAEATALSARHGEPGVAGLAVEEGEDAEMVDE